MRTTLYLVRHGATAANLAHPARLQGRRSDPPLAPVGIRQAEATRELLARLPIQACYCSPLLRAVETAAIIAAPHKLTPMPIAELIECDVGRWEGLDWDTIRDREPESYRGFMADPAANPYPDGESFADVHIRAAPTLDRLIADHPGQTLLVVSHHVVNRTYLAGRLGLPMKLSRNVALDNCGVSVVTSEGGQTTAITLNAVFHLAGIAP
jgi:broad specificity phosphatase PhoE